MKKAILAVLFCLMLTAGAASADTMDVLKPVWLLALEEAQAGDETVVYPEPQIISATEGLEVVRGTVYMSKHYSAEAYVYAELKNTGDTPFYVNGTTLGVLGADGQRLSGREYADSKPGVIMPGESAFVTEWLYDFVDDPGRVHTIEVNVERSQHGYRSIEMLPDARAYAEDGYLYAEVHNASDKPVFDAGVTAVMLDAGGKILDILQVETYANVGAAPGSTLVFRKRLEGHAMNRPDAVFEAYAYVYHD